MKVKFLLFDSARMLTDKVCLKLEEAVGCGRINFIKT